MQAGSHADCAEPQSEQLPPGPAEWVRYRDVRQFTEALCEPLAAEDTVVQSMPEVSPTRWHLAHTTWFFEQFVLGRTAAGYRPFHPHFHYLFNSYYNRVGPQFPRPHRGLLSRPTLAEVLQYRRVVDGRMQSWLDQRDSPDHQELLPLVGLGRHHEQQHQELILTDIKHVLSCNPLYPVYQQAPLPEASAAPSADWVGYPEGLHWIGHPGGSFAYDNERPRHRVFLPAYQLASHLVVNGQYLAFIDDGGYRRPELWLAAGWDQVQANGWQAPLYWTARQDGWWQFTLSGLRPVDPAEPVCHISYFEAEAFARWAGQRLPTEAEWEHAAATVPLTGNFVERRAWHPLPAGPGANSPLQQMYGDLWQWTASPYTPYPGYRSFDGALEEYNGKFMCNQYVLRGGSCATPRSHLRTTYRNFFPPEARWQFSGIRLARST